MDTSRFLGSPQVFDWFQDRSNRNEAINILADAGKLNGRSGEELQLLPRW